MRCAEIPHLTFGRVLLPLLRAGLCEAMAYHQRGYRMVATNPAFMVVFARHIVFLCLTDNLAKALKLVERHLPDALAAPRRSLRVLSRLQAAARTPGRTAQIRDQGAPAGKRADARFKGPLRDCGVERGEVAQELRDLGVQFDDRNGNRVLQRTASPNSRN